MYAVRGEFPDYSRHNNKGSFALNPDKGFNPYTWGPPIVWTGFVNNTAVRFVQTSSSAMDVTDFNFDVFPEQHSSAISYIIEAIDDAMKIMD